MFQDGFVFGKTSSKLRRKTLMENSVIIIEAFGIAIQLKWFFDDSSAGSI